MVWHVKHLRGEDSLQLEKCDTSLYLEKGEDEYGEERREED